MQSTDTAAPKDQKLSAGLISWLNDVGLSPLLLLCLAVLSLAPLFITDQYTIRLLVVSLYFGSLAMAFDFTGGYINAVNFGFAGFVGMGAYAAALMAIHTNLGIGFGLAAAALATGLVGFLTGLLTLPLRGIYVSLMSWFVGMTLMALAGAMIQVTRGARGLIVPPLAENASNIDYLYFLLLMTIGVYLLLRVIIRSRIGLAFKAIGQNFESAQASGVNPTRYKLLNFTLSCACAGFFGGFYAHFVGIVTPDIMDTGHTLEVMTLSFIGGSGSLIGGIFAAFLLIPIFDSLKKLMEYRLVIYGMLLILVMIFYPAGLAGLYQRAVEAYQKLRGKRHEDR
jgi:branched-chain amino acid transport system permease protein